MHEHKFIGIDGIPGLSECQCGKVKSVIKGEVTYYGN